MPSSTEGPIAPGVGVRRVGERPPATEAAGASGAWIGTAFAACPESLASDATRTALVAASATDTVTTRVFDLALGHPWPDRFPERILRSEVWERGAVREEVLVADREEAA